MRYGLYIRKYAGMYFVEYSTKSVGMTLLATWDRKQAEEEIEKYMSMTRTERRNNLLGDKSR